MRKVCEVYLVSSSATDERGVELTFPVSQYEMMDAFEQIHTKSPMNEERFAKEMKKIQSVISRALQKANTLTALADGGKMSREKLQLTLEETAYFFESATLYLRALCETQMPGAGGYGRRDGLEFQLPSGHIEIAGAAWAGLLDPAALPADFREFATPTVLIDSPEAAKDWQNYKPEFDFSRPFDCRVAG